MTHEATVEAELMAVWESRGIDPASFAPDASGTLSEHDVRADDAALEAWAGVGEASIDLGAIIGRGGMGVVREATQAELRRQVAVKELREESAEASTIAALLREAWISGNLEHPNIVPVHALVKGDHGPRLVMKRVEGRSWAGNIRAATSEVALERDLQVLRQVCHAVHFAHSRGVVHLDLKPQNVMIGSFGEVYLVDWGIAAAFEPDAPAWLPRTDAITNVCGTPAYAAPETAAGEGAKIGVRTDVYGLGALLHALLTGQPRHSGRDLRATLCAAWISAPFEYAATVPRELAAIANRATARDPADRFANAEAFRLVIEDFLSHRASTRLSDEADRRREALVRIADKADLERAVSECTFVYEQALALWPENPAALDGKRALAERREAELAALKRIERNVDINVNRISRSTFAALCGLLWVLWNFGSGIAMRHLGVAIDYPKLWASAAGTIVVYVGALIIFWKKLSTTTINRGMVLLVGAFFGITVLGWIGAAFAGLTPMQAIAQTNPIYVAYAAALALFVDRRAWAPAVVISPSVAIGPAFPELAFEIAGVTGAVLGFWLAWIWRKPFVSPLES